MLLLKNNNGMLIRLFNSNEEAIGENMAMAEGEFYANRYLIQARHQSKTNKRRI